MFTIMDRIHPCVHAITATEADAIIFVAQFLKEYDYTLDYMGRLFPRAPLTIRAYAQVNEKKIVEIEFLIQEVEEWTP